MAPHWSDCYQGSEISLINEWNEAVESINKRESQEREKCVSYESLCSLRTLCALLVPHCCQCSVVVGRLLHRWSAPSLCRSHSQFSPPQGIQTQLLQERRVCVGEEGVQKEAWCFCVCCPGCCSRNGTPEQGLEPWTLRVKASVLTGLNPTRVQSSPGVTG